VIPSISTLVLVVLVAYVVWSVYFIQRYLRIVVKIFINAEIERNAENYPELPGDRVTFKSTDGVDLVGRFVSPADGPEGRPTVIFCHEWGSDRNSATRFALWLVDRGYNLLALDFRRHGESGDNGAHYVPRHWTTSKEVMDLKGAVAYLAGRPDVDPGRIAAFGLSRGATTALVAAATTPEIRSVVSDGAFSTKLTIQHYMRKWVSIYVYAEIVYRNLPNWIYRFVGWLAIKAAQVRLRVRFPSVESAVAEMTAPVLFIHGRADSKISYRQAYTLYSLAREPKEIWIVNDARHNEAIRVAGAEYRRRVGDFLDRHVGAPRPVESRAPSAGV
jgi:dipeptidyl aminopeptidase/acylaminoacyl peptidase